MNKQGNSTGEETIFIVFLILKLTHVISWSWWWITSPLWIGAALIVSGAAVILALARHYR